MAGAIAASALAGWGASRLVLRQDLRDFLPQESRAASRIPAEILRDLAGSDRLAIVLEGKDSIPIEDVARVFDALTPGLTSLPGVHRVVSRVALAESRFLTSAYPQRVALYLNPAGLAAAGERLTRSAMEARLLADSTPRDLLSVLDRQNRDPLGLLRLAIQPMRGWQGVARLRNIDGYLSLPRSRAFFLLIEPEGPMDDAQSARRLVTTIQYVVRQTREDPRIAPLLTGRELYAAGQLVGRVSTVEALRADGSRVAGAASIAILAFLILAFRTLAAPLVITLTVTLGLAVTAALTQVLMGGVGLLAWMFTGLMVGLGVDYGIYICTQYWVHAPEGGGEKALIAALTRPGPGITMGALTSAAGFITLVLIPYPWTREVGVLSSLGLLVILTCSVTFLPLLLTFSRSARQATLSSWWEAAAGAVERSRLLHGSVPWMLLVLAAAMLLPTLHFEAHPWRLMVRGNPESARVERLSHEAGTTFSPILVVSTGSSEAEALGRDREAMFRLRRVALPAGVATIQSLAQWLPPPEQQRTNLAFVRAHPDMFDAERVRSDFTATVSRMVRPDSYLISEYLPRILAAVGPPPDTLTVADLRTLGLGETVDRHLVHQGGSYFAVSYVYLRRLPISEGVVSTFLAAARAAGVTSVPGVTLAGAALRAAETEVIRRAVLGAALLATLLVLAILWFRFRRASLVLLCMVPLVCGLSATVVAMPLIGIEFNLMTAAIAPILVGTGVDDGIHVVDRLHSGQDLATVLREAGSSMMMATLTTVAAFASLVLARFTGIKEVGMLGAIGMLTCMLAAIQLVPLLWRLVGGHASPPVAAGKS